MSEKLWVEQYMREVESSDRRRIFEAAAAEEGLTPDNELRQKLLEARYPFVDGREIDTFIRGWMNLMFLDNASKGRFAKKRIEKDKKNILSDLQIDLAREYGETGSEVLYQEFFNLAKVFMNLCMEDKAYGSVLFGLGQMKKDKRVAKIAWDLYRVAYTIPRECGLADELSLFTKAVTDAYCEVFDKQKQLLLNLVHEGKKE